MTWHSRRNSRKGSCKSRGQYSRLCRLGVEALEPKLLLAADAFEPNNSFVAAYMLPPVGSQTINSLTIDAGDEDVFRWTATNTGGVRVALTSATNIDLEVYNSTGTILLGNSLNSGANERVEIAVTGSQTYLVRILGETFTTTNPGYSLSFLEVPLDTLDAASLNNTRATATNLMSTTPTFNGLSLHAPNDNDYFRFVAPGNGTFVVDATFLHSNGNVDLELQASNGAELTRSDSLTNNERIAYDLSAGEVVYLRVFSESAQMSPNYSLDFGFSQLPTIGAIGQEDTLFGRTLVLPLSLSDPDNLISELKLGAVSANNSVVSTGDISFDLSGPVPTMSLRPRGLGISNVTITVKDPDGGIATEEFTFRVVGADLNSPPTIASIGNRVIDEDTSSGAIAITVNDPGFGGNPNTVVLSAKSSDQSLIADSSFVFGGTGTARTLQFTPQLHKHGGPVSVIVTATDADGASSSTLFTVTVNAVADQPDLTVTNVTANEDAAIPLNISPALVDTDGSEYLAIRIAGVPTGGRLSAGVYHTGNGFWYVSPLDLPGLTLIPPPNHVAPIELTVRALVEESSNGNTNGRNRTLNITINPLNDAPTISKLFSQATPSNTPTAAIPFTIADVDNAVNGLTVTATSSNENVVANSNIVLAGTGANRTITITPENVVGEATITVSVFDGTTTTVQEFDLIVGGTNTDAPTISTVSNKATNESTALPQFAVTVGDTETAAAALVLSATSSDQALVPNGNITITSGVGGERFINIQPIADISGTATITLTVDDGQGKQTTTTFLLAVNAVNDAPIISPVNDIVINEDTSSAALTVVIGDEETAPNPLSLTASSNNPGLIPNANIQLGGNGNVRFVKVTPLPNQTGTAVITLTLSDGVNSSIEQFQVTVNGINDAPTISSISNQTINENSTVGPLGFTVGDAETAAAGLTVTARSGNQAMFADENIVISGAGANKTITLTPQAGAFGGPLPIVVTVSDGVLSTSTTFYVTTLDVNQPPTISDIPNQTVAEDSTLGPLNFTVNDNDHNPASLSVTASSNNQLIIPNGNISVSGSGTNRSVTLTPAPNANGGPVTITLTVSDGVSSAVETFTVNVTPVNDPGTFGGNLSATTPEDTATSGTATFTDPADGFTTPNFQLDTNASHGTATINAAGNWTYTPASNYNGNDSFIIKVTDDDGHVETRVIAITVIEATPDLADFDGDGDVDGRDFLLWQRGFGTTSATKADGDANNNGVVDGSDLAIWQGQYGTGSFVAELSVSNAADIRIESFDVRRIDTVALDSYESYLSSQIEEVQHEPTSGTVDSVRLFSLPTFGIGDKSKITDDIYSEEFDLWSLAVADSPEEFYSLDRVAESTTLDDSDFGSEERSHNKEFDEAISSWSGLSLDL